MADNKWHVIPLYAAAMQDARASGDVEAMEALAKRAESEGADNPEVQRELGELRGEISRLRGNRSDTRVLYGVVIQDARASGDVQRMRDVARRAESEGANDPEIQSALRDLKAEIDRAGG